eukprot:CAMPEP_0117448518 /NCGR_PEP_ID=MMETSP0759-20121206/7443_1 /TAXON_ID=63605 /ORGANISM="Percolomonas cosmopolitus, Strain WS" /LENGTH=705 /DNA_ID=CAMNT_0005240909 /DNA_START=230 /DNA_END=2347 /DNA_ORIENTATION=+
MAIDGGADHHEDWSSRKVGHHFFILVYSVASLDSFRHCCQLYETFSAENDHSRGSSTLPPLMQYYPTILIGTHADVSASHRQIPISEIESFALKHSLFYLEVSCTDGLNVALMKNICGIRIEAYVERMQQEEWDGNFPQIEEEESKDNVTMAAAPDQDARHLEDYEQQTTLSALRSNDYARSSQETVSSDEDAESDMLALSQAPSSPTISVQQQNHQGASSAHSIHTPISSPLTRLSYSPPLSIASYSSAHTTTATSKFSRHHPNNVTIHMSPDGQHNSKVVRVNSSNTDASPPQSVSPAAHGMHPQSPPLLSPLSAPFPLEEQQYSPESQYPHSHHDDNDSDLQQFFSGNGDIRLDLSPAERKFRQDLQRHSHFLTALHTEHNQKDESMSEYIKNYHETKDGHVIPVISTDLKTSKASNVIYQRRVKEYKEKIFIDLQIGNGSVAQIAVQDGDNIFELAKKLQKAYRLQSSQMSRNQLAYMLKQAITKYMQKKKRKGSTKRENFMLETEKRANNIRSQPALLKMEFDLGNSRSGTIVVRKGASPTVLAQNFVNMYGLRKVMIQTIASKIEEQLFEHYSTEAKNLIQQISPLEEHNESRKRTVDLTEEIVGEADSNATKRPRRSPLTTTASPSKMSAKILFNMEVEIARGRYEKFPVRAGEHPSTLARYFAKQHGLSLQAEKTLLKLIKHHLRDYEERKKRERAR